MLRPYTDKTITGSQHKSHPESRRDKARHVLFRSVCRAKPSQAFVVGVAALALFVHAATANALAAWLTESELRSALAGKTLDGQYANGQAFTESYGEDGRLWYLEAGNRIYGRWSITAGTFCTIYDTDSSGGCFRVAKVSKNCFEFYFVSRTEDAAPGGDGNKPKWTARAAVSGEDEACKDEVAV